MREVVPPNRPVESLNEDQILDVVPGCMVLTVAPAEAGRGPSFAGPRPSFCVSG